MVNHDFPTTWVPSPDAAAATHIGRLMRQRNQSFEALCADAVDDPESYWAHVLGALQVRFDRQPDAVRSPDGARLPGAELNLAASALACGDEGDIVLVRGLETGSIERWTRADLTARVRRAAAALEAMGVKPGDALAIAMPMTAESVVLYLAIVWVGAAVVSIADSFSAQEMRTRLEISGARAAFTQDLIPRGSKQIPLYERLVEAGAERVVVLPLGETVSVPLAEGHTAYDQWLAAGEGLSLEPHSASIERISNIPSRRGRPVPPRRYRGPVDADQGGSRRGRITTCSPARWWSDQLRLDDGALADLRCAAQRCGDRAVRGQPARDRLRPVCRVQRVCRCSGSSQV